MKKIEWWTMYFETQRLKKQGLKISQIARALSLSRNTVYRYLEMNPEDLEQERERRKKLDIYTDEIVSWLKKYPDLSAAQVEDWLEEKNGKKIRACESTVRNFVREIRKIHNIPKVMYQRDYQATEDLPMGQQVQVDFGEFKLLDTSGNSIKLWFIAFVLAHSRYKYVEWLDRPFTTRNVIRTHENAFRYFGGKPKELVYDQDHLILVHENYGDLIFTKQFIVIETDEIVAPHALSLGKGKLIRNNNHLRDRSQTINRLTEEVVGLLKNTDAVLFLAGIREAKPRYVRDQLELIRGNLTKKSQKTIDQALVFCLKNQLYSAVDFCDALTHFSTPSRGSQSVSSTPNEVQQLNQEAQSKLKTKPQVRDIQDYVSVCEGDNRRR